MSSRFLSLRVLRGRPRFRLYDSRMRTNPVAHGLIAPERVAEYVRRLERDLEELRDAVDAGVVSAAVEASLCLTYDARALRRTLKLPAALGPRRRPRC